MDIAPPDPTRATRLSHSQYLVHLRRETARFADALAQLPDDARVPTCPDWAAVDLLWHLAEVQWFWATVVARRAADPESLGVPQPQRPPARSDLAALSERCGADLATALAERDPAEHCWTWADEQTVGWVARRQAHEALIHRLDAELTAGSPTPLDPALALDGVDEALRLMFGGVPGWAQFRCDPQDVVRIAETATNHSRLLTVGRLQGDRPDSGLSVDEPAFEVLDVDDGRPAAGTVRGLAAHLDSWMWNRAEVTAVERSGSARVLDGVAAVLKVGVQ